MRQDEKLTYYEAWCLFTVTFCYHMFNDVLSTLVELAGTAAWIAQIFSACLSFGFLALFLALYRRYPGMDLLEIFDTVYGRLFGRIVSAALLAFLVIYCAASLNQLVETLQFYAYTRMRALTIDLLIMATVSVFGIYSIKGMAKTVSILLPGILLAWILTLVLSFDQYDADLLNPIWGYGLGSTAARSVDLLSEFSGILLLGVFGKSIGGVGEYKKAALTGIIVASVMFTATTLCYNMAVPYDSASYLPAGVLGLAESTYNNRFLQKLEVVFTAVIVASIILLIGVSFMAIKKTYCHIFAIPQSFAKGVVFPLVLLVVCVTRTMGTNIAYRLQLRHLIRRQGGLICLGFILVTLLVGSIRRQGKQSAVKALGLLLVPCLALGLLTGCTEAHEPDEDMYPIIMGFDKGENEKFRLTLKFMLGETAGHMASPINQEAEPGQVPIDMMVLECPSFTEGINMVNALMPKEISFLHIKMMVISEELAREGIQVFVGQALRFSEIKPTMAIVVSRCSAYELIEAQKSDITDSLQMDMERILEPHKTSTYYMTRNMSQMLYEFQSTYGDAVAAYGNVNQAEYRDQIEEEERPDKKISHTTATFEDGFLAGEVPIMGNSEMELAGMAVFREDKMVGTLSTKESQILGLLNGSFRNAYVILPDMLNPEKDYITFIFRRVRSVRWSTWIDEEGTAHISITAPFNAIIGLAQNAQADYIGDAELRLALEQYVEQAMAQRAAELTERLQREMDADILQLGRRVARNFRTIQAWEEYNWAEKFKDAVIDVSFSINL